MSMVETSIFIDSDPVHEAENKTPRGNLVARLFFKDGWCSPNHYMGQHWSRTKKIKDSLDEQSRAQFYSLSPDKRSEIVAGMESDPPKKRSVVIHIVKTRGPYPDIENLVGGCKLLIDALKFRRSTRVQTDDPARKTGYKVEYRNVGNPWIYDDSHDKFRISEIHLSRRSDATWFERQHPNIKGSYVLVDLYDEPEVR